MATFQEKVSRHFTKAGKSSIPKNDKLQKTRPHSLWSDSRSVLSEASSVTSGYLTGSSSSVVHGSSSFANLPGSDKEDLRWTSSALYEPSAPPPFVGSVSTHDMQRRLSSNSRFSMYMASTSSWDWDDDDEALGDDEDFEENDSFEDLPDSSFVSTTRWRWSGRKTKGAKTSNAVPKHTVPLDSTSSSGSSVDDGPSRIITTNSEFERNKIMHASCPALDLDISNLSRALAKQLKKKGKNQDKVLESAKSVAHLGQKLGEKPTTNKITNSKSTGCIPETDKITPIEFKFKKPVTHRFTPSGLTEGHRIVWLSEFGDVAGKVHWVGKIRNIFHAGIEFDKPIGNSSGIYGYGHGLQIRLFTCKLGYGRFVPVDQLILYEDYYEHQKTGFICIICRDDFIEPGQHDGFDAANKIMVTTRCGHLFHQTCLNQWFNEKPSSTQQCPYCNLPMERNDTIRIFPAQAK